MYSELIFYNFIFYVIFLPWSLYIGQNQSFCGKKILLYDEACLYIKDNNHHSKLLKQTTECYKCDGVPIPDITKPVVIQTTYPTILQLFSDDNEFSNNETVFHFEQHGHYNITLTDGIDIVVDKPPKDAFIPLKIELFALFIIVILWSINGFASYYSSRFHRYFDIRGLFQSGFTRELQNDFGTPSENTTEPAGLISTETSRSSLQMSRSARVQSLDTFRGLTIALMIFVNYGGGKYKFFQHAPWNGLTVADVIFPWFAFVMGMSLLLSISALFRITNSRSSVFLKIFLRSLVLIALGIILNSVNHDDIYKIRYPGVLQRLGLAYFIVGSMETIFLRIHMSESAGGRTLIMQMSGKFQSIMSILLLGIHSCLVFLLQVPGCPTGYLGPGGLYDHRSFENCTGGATGYIDRIIFTEQHLYNRSTAKKVYQNKLPFDPEGLLGTLTTAFTVFLGVHAVRLYLIYRSPRKLILQWLFIAAILGLVAGFLCEWSQEGGLVPINKNIWSISYALATGALAFLAMSILYFIVDYKRFWSGSPFKEVGKNSILLYLGSSLLKEAFPWHWTPVDMTTHTESLIMDTWGTTLWIVISVILSKNHIYLAI